MTHYHEPPADRPRLHGEDAESYYSRTGYYLGIAPTPIPPGVTKNITELTADECHQVAGLLGWTLHVDDKRDAKEVQLALYRRARSAGKLWERDDCYSVYSGYFTCNWYVDLRGIGYVPERLCEPRPARRVVCDDGHVDLCGNGYVPSQPDVPALAKDVAPAPDREPASPQPAQPDRAQPPACPWPDIRAQCHLREVER